MFEKNIFKVSLVVGLLIFTLIAKQNIPSTMFTAWRGTDPTTSITIQWLSFSENSRKVGLINSKNGISNAGIESNTVNFSAEVYRHRVDLLDLSPDTRYEITLDGEKSGLYIKTAPDTLSKELTFIQGGDIALGEDGRALHEIAANYSPLFALVGGDMADSEPPIPDDAPDWREFLLDWHDKMRTDDNILIPIVAAIGNHEIDDGKATQYFMLFDNTRREEAYWVFNIENYLSIFVMDNELDYEKQILGKEKYWLKKELIKRVFIPHKFAVMHTPPYTLCKSRYQARSKMTREHWVPIWEKYGIDVVFQDDDELYGRTFPLIKGNKNSNGIVYVGNGGWGEYDDRKIAGEMQGEEVDKGEEMTDEEVKRALSQFAVKKECNYVIRVTIHPNGRQQYLAFNTNGKVDEFEINRKD